MGKLVRISDAVGPRTFGTAPITERPSASAQSSPAPASPAIPRLDLAGMSRDALEAGVLPASTQFGMLELPTGAAVQRQNQREETAQRLDDQRRQALEAERYQLTLPGRVYNEETTSQNRARVQEIDQELSMLKPERSGRLKSGVQSILSSTLGAPFAIGETIAQMGRNAAAQANDPEYQSLSERYSQIMGRMAGLEQSYKGHEDYLYATPQWNELAQERDEVLASLRQRGTELDKPVDVTSDGMRLMRESNQYREQALEGLEGVPRFLGSTALSIGQNAALLPLAAVNPAASLAAMSAVSSADRMYELSERGLPASEALGRGLISGGIEAATEKIPLENLLSVVRTGGTSALRNILRQAGIEAGEESVSYMANYLADLAVQDPEARFSLAELAQSAAGGALSGGVFGTGGTILNGLSNDYTFVPFSDLRITLPIRPGQKVVLPQDGERQSHIVEEAGPGGAETGGAGGYYAGQTDAEADLSAPTAAASSATVQSPSTLQTQKTAPTEETGGNSRLTANDLADYLRVGKKQSVRNAKQAAVDAGESIILTDNIETQNYIQQALTGETTSNTPKAYGKVGQVMADDIFAASDGAFDVEGWYLELVPSDIKHAFDQHAAPKRAGNIALTEQDFLNIPAYIDTYDDILACKTYSSGDKEILLGKKINGYSVIVEVVSGNRRSLHFKNMWGLDTDTYERRYEKRSATSRPGRSDVSANDPTGAYHSASSSPIISAEGQEVNPVSNGQIDRKRSSQQGIQIPVETRTWQDASNRKVNAFQYDHPELHPYYAEAAKALQHELSQGTKGERFTLKDQDGYISSYTGSKRAQASPVEQALDNANLSYSDIDKALTAIINDQGQENYAAAKKMELVLDDMLSNGYTGADGMEYGPNESYLSARDAVNLGLPAESTEYRMGEEEWASLQASEPPESVYETGGQSDSLSVPTDEYIPNPGAGPQYLTGPESSVGGAREEFDPWSHFQNQRSQFIPEGANAARPVDVPTTDPQGRQIRRTASTAMGAKAIPDEAVADIQNMVLRGELSYNRVTDKASIDRAIKTIEEKTYAGALEEFRSAVSKGVVSKDIATLGQQLLINAANAGDEKITAEMLSLYAQMETTAGQAVQAASILRKLSPTSQLYAAQRMVSDLEKTIQKSYKDLEITIDPALLEKFSQQTDQAGRDKVLEEIYQNVADQIPANWRDKWNAWRYMAMLVNPKTHIRNFFGNVGFGLERAFKDRVAAAIEAGISAANGGKLQKTKTALASLDLYKAAWADWANVKDVLSGNKYDDVRSEINSRRRIFRTAPLEYIRTKNSSWLEAEDAIFKKIAYADALAGYLQANGVTAEQVRNNTVDTQIMSSARDYAGKEALKATYQDRNRVSDKAVEITRSLGLAGEAILPFKRTPANVLVRGVEYSPVGLARGLKNYLWDVKRGKMTGAEAIDRIASGLTGTGLFALGAALYSLGAVTSGGGDDENEDRLNDLIGKQNYALNLPGGVNVTLDWLAPAALPFFMGVELVDSLGRNGNTADSITSALKSISDPMLELSMLQSLNDVIDSVSFSENKLGALAASALISYFTQAVPTIGGQIERSAEPVRMSTYVDKNNPLPTDVQYALGRASARIPIYEFQQIPYIDAWGRDESSGPLILRMANSFINPSYTSITEVTPVDEEIRRLYNETGDGTVVPERPERTLTLDGGKINLTAEQYTKYATDRGQMRFSMLEDLFDRAEYAAMPATNRSAMVNDIYTFTDKVAKAEISDYVPDGWVEDVVDSGLDPVEYIIFRNMVSNISGEGKKDQIVAVIDSMDIPDAEKDRYYLTYGYSENTLGDTPWN